MRMRIATPVCALARNDMDFVTIRTKFGAESTFCCHCEEGCKASRLLLSVAAKRLTESHAELAIRTYLNYNLSPHSNRSGVSKSSSYAKSSVQRVMAQSPNC